MKPQYHDTAVVTFGRMNPPTLGHLAIINKVAEIAKALDATGRVYLSQSQDPKTNPLSERDKYRYISAVAPEGVEIVRNKTFKSLDTGLVRSVKHPFDMLTQLAQEGFKIVYFVVGENREGHYNRMYDWAKQVGLRDFEIVNVGELARGVHASDLRKYAKDGDFVAFSRGCAVKGNLARQMYNAVRAALNKPVKKKSQLAIKKESLAVTRALNSILRECINSGVSPQTLPKFNHLKEAANREGLEFTSDCYEKMLNAVNAFFGLPRGITLPLVEQDRNVHTRLENKTRTQFRLFTESELSQATKAWIEKISFLSDDIASVLQIALHWPDVLQMMADDKAMFKLDNVNHYLGEMLAVAKFIKEDSVIRGALLANGEEGAKTLLELIEVMVILHDSRVNYRMLKINHAHYKQLLWKAKQLAVTVCKALADAYTNLKTNEQLPEDEHTKIFGTSN
jgi:nicotinic acid mononucleotide adenylyltransferase